MLKKPIRFNDLQNYIDHYWTSLDMAEVDALSAKNQKASLGRFFRFGLSSDTERFQRLLPASRNAGSGGTQPADLLQNV